MSGPVDASVPYDCDALCVRLARCGVKWDAPKWKRFLTELPKGVQRLEVEMYQDSEEAAPFDTWAEILTILGDVVVVAGGVAGITGAISGIQAVVKG